MLTPPVTRTKGVERKRHRRLDGQARAIRLGDRRIGGQCKQRRVAPGVVEARDLDSRTEPVGGQLPAFERRSGRPSTPRRGRRCCLKANPAVTRWLPPAHRDIERAAPALLGVVDELRSRRRERNPPRALFLAELEHDADAAALAAAGDAPVDGEAGALVLEPVVQLVGLIVIEPPADQRLQPIAQRAADLGFGNAAESRRSRRCIAR